MVPFAAPWGKSYPAGMTARAAIDTFPVHNIVAQAAGRWPERTAIDFRKSRISYRQLASAIGNAARRFADIGVVKGDRVALLLPNTPWHPVTFFAALSAGATVVHLSPLDSPRVLKHKMEDSGARILVATNWGELAQGAAALASSCKIDRLIVAEDRVWGAGAGHGTLPANADFTYWDDAGTDTAPQGSSFPEPDLEEVALLQYSGGTTGMPKAACLTHRNLSASTSSYELWYRGWGLVEDDTVDRILLFLPLFHIYGLSTVLLRALKTGNEIMLRTRFDPIAALDDIEAGATVFPGVPTMWIAMAATPGFESRDFSSLRIAASGGAPMPVDLANRLRAQNGLDIVGGWGMSETSPAGSNLPPGRPDKAATIGIPLPGVFMKIVSLEEPSRELPPDDTGEIAVKGLNVTSGYHNRPQDNETCFCDGWFLTGDIGFMDADGFFTIVDRKKDMILSGGFNVYPQIIEQAIYEHRDVEEVLVIGVADSYRGEAAKAFVKLRDNASAMTLDALQEFLKDKLGRHEMPTSLEIRSALPKTPVGKLSKIELKQEEARRAGNGLTIGQADMEKIA